jgi:hypothetical protein
MSEFKIDRGMPAPPPNRGRRNKYPTDELDVGDSFFVPGKVHSQLSGVKANAKRKGINLVLRRDKVDGIVGVRVFRVE